MGGERPDEEPTEADDDRPDSRSEPDADTDPEASEATDDQPEQDPYDAAGTPPGAGPGRRKMDEAAVEEARAGGSEPTGSVAGDPPEETTDGSAEPSDDAAEESDVGTDLDREPPEDLEDVDGVGASRADALREAGYETVEDLRAASRAELTDVAGIGDALAARIKAHVGGVPAEESEPIDEGDEDDSPTTPVYEDPAPAEGEERVLSGPTSDEEMPLTDHIEEMVKRLAIVVAIAGIVSLATFPFAERIINFLWYNIMPGVPSDIARPRLYGVLELMFTKLKVASLAGLIIALPALVYETYQFMRPGLYPHERRYYLAAIPASLVLALVGVSFAYFVVLPAIFTYFLAYSQDVATIGFALGRTFNLILALMGYLALVFQIPLFIMLAMMMGLVTRRWLANRRLLFWGSFLGISFIFSPDPTGMAPVVIALTMVGLFEGTLLLTKWAGRE